MPAFSITVNEDWVRVAIVPALSDATSSYGPLGIGQGVTIAAKSAADAESLVIEVTGRFGIPAFTLTAGEPAVSFKVDLGDGSDPVTYGPFDPPVNQGDPVCVIAAGPQGVPVQTATVTVTVPA
jgi:hypothetical protein